MVKPGDRRNIAAYLKKAHQVSITRACQTIGLAKSMYYYKSVRDDNAVIAKLKELAEQKPTRGFWYYYGRIRNEGLVWNHKKVKRVYIGIHPYLLHAQMFMRSVGVRPMLYSYQFINR